MCGIAEARARRDRVGGMALPVIVFGPTAAAMPPCAQALEPDMPGRVPGQHQGREGRKLQRREQAGDARAQDQRAVGLR